MKQRLTRQRPSLATEEHPPPYAVGPTTVIRPTQGWVPVRLRELFQFRELLYFLVWSDLTVRYKQTVLGAAWAVLHPLAVMAVYTVFFGIVVRVPTEIPYPIFVFSGVVVWQYFVTALNRASNSMLEQQALITKVYFPRLVVPVASVVAGLVDFAFAFAVLVPLIAFYPGVGFSPTGAVFALPLFLLLAVMGALSVSLWLSALMVQYRDVRLLLSVVVRAWFFATPIVYPSSLVPESWRPFYEALNPMVGAVEGFRWALLGSTEAPNPTTLAVSAALVAVILVSGLYYFRRVERTFADVV